MNLHWQAPPCSECGGEGFYRLGFRLPKPEGWVRCPVCAGTGKEPGALEEAELEAGLTFALVADEGGLVGAVRFDPETGPLDPLPKRKDAS